MLHRQKEFDIKTYRFERPIRSIYSIRTSEDKIIGYKSYYKSWYKKVKKHCGDKF